MTTETRTRDRTIWQRLIFMVLFGVILQVVNAILTVFVVVQFLFKAVTGRLFEHARPFAQSLSTYVYEIILFLTFRSDVLPWPFSPWPANTPEERDEVQHPSFDFGTTATGTPRYRRRGPRTGTSGSGSATL